MISSGLLTSRVFMFGAATPTALILHFLTKLLLLLLAHVPLVEVRAFSGQEALAILGFHQRHAELIEPIAGTCRSFPANPGRGQATG